MLHARPLPGGIVAAMLTAVLLFPARPASAADDIRIDEFNITCVNGFSNAAFVELTAAGPDQIYDNTIKLRFLNSNGTTRYEMPIGVSALAGQSWPQGRRWLIGYSNFFGTTQVVPDAEMTNVPATSGAVLLIRGSGTNYIVLDRVDYVNNGAIPAPTLGRSLQRQPDLSWVIKSAPDPTTAAGTVAAAASCFQATAISARVNEMQLLCRNGLISGQFIELTATSLSATRDAAMRLRVFDRNEGLITEITNLFGASAGQPWANGTEWLLGPATLKGPQGQAPDFTLPTALDTVAGRVLFVLVGLNGSETVLSDIRYGTPSLPRPSYGKSLSYSTGYSENPLPTPKASNALIYADPLCDRPLPSTAFLAEAQLQCWDGSTGTQFLEFGVTGSGEFLWPELRLEAFDHNGQLIGTIENLFGTSQNATWMTSRRWLIATGGFRDAQLHQANLLLPFTLDPVGGRIILSDTKVSTGSQVVSDLRYGAGGVAVPSPGHSLQWNGATYAELTTPTPFGFSGLAYTDGVCGKPPIAVEVREAQFQCANGSLTGQFLELGLRGGDEIFDPRVQLVIRDRNGAIRSRMSQIFGARSGSSWSSARPWLMATNSYRDQTGTAPDVLLPATLDTLGGQIELVQTANGSDLVLSSLTYGPAGIPTPPLGRALSVSGTTYIEAVPTPLGFNQRAYAADLACSMPFQSGVVLQEVQLQCSNGLNQGQFIELRSTLVNDRFDARHRIRAFDRNDQLIGEVSVTASSPGDVWPANGLFLIANPIWRNDHGPDVVLPFTLDDVAGRIELLGPYGATNTTVLGLLSYGHPGELAVTPGGSFVLLSGSTYTISTNPTPNGASGATYTAGRCSAPALSQFQISEIGTGCLGSGGASFIELRSAPNAYHDADVIVIVRDHLGDEIGQVTNLFGSYTSTSWPVERRWLLWNAAFATQTGTTGANLPFTLNAEGGAIVMRQTIFGQLVTVDSVSYGPGHEAPLPAPGMSISRASLGGVFAASFPTPTMLQQVVFGSNCFDPQQWSVRISEFATACVSGGAQGQFVELTSLASGFAYYSTLQLRFYNAANVLLGTSTNMFSGFADTAWPPNGTFALGRGDVAPCTGAFDASLPVVLDTTAGRIELVAITSGLETIVQSLSYGAGASIPPPSRGASVERQPDGSYGVTATPTPKNRSGLTIALPGCDYSLPPVRIQHFALGCAGGHVVGQFVELRATAAFVIPPTLALQIQEGTRAPVNVDIPTSYVGRQMQAGSAFLFASDLWTTHLGRCADAKLPPLPSSGVIRLIDRSGGSCLRYVDEATYGSAGGITVPTPGVGIARTASGGWVHEPWPTPTCSNGDTTWLVPCHSADPRQTVVVQEFATMDAAHDPRNQFIEISSSGAGQLAEKRVGIRTYDSNGALIQNITEASLSEFYGLWRPGVPHILLATNTLLTGSYRDPVLTGLDTLGGRIEITYQPSTGGARQVVSQLSYGPGTGVAAPGPGYSAQRMPDGSYLSTARPTPANLGGPLSMAYYPIAGCEIASLISSTGENEPVGSPTFDRLQLIAPTRSTFDKSRGTVSSSAGPGMAATTIATDRYSLEGPPGSSINAIARMRVTVDMRCDSTGCASGAGDFAVILNNTASSRQLVATGSATIDFPIVMSVGSPLVIGQRVIAPQASGPGFTRRVFADAQLEFVGIPAGMKITSCSGYLQDQPVPVLLALAEAVAASDQARLVWRVDQSAAFEARVQRREEGSEWLDIGTVRVDGAGQLEFTDSSVLPLHRYAYRLTWSDPERGTISAGEAWLDIPRALAFALHGARPNPSRGALTVAFQLATEGEVRIELLDIAGRRVLEHQVDRMAPGDHLISLARAGSVAPGMYALRLRQGERSATTRVIVTR